ncbi:MAG: hypothetical protein A3H27_14495 [Acidobacteria bacterium RIFCSPLOWO2_02_FULL_59_13]|nr:MAG: hypothetical protein A3H27_14495 [Acidobacteria bacterium RIFCSPLOWO2_02_FULL_59_13]
MQYPTMRFRQCLVGVPLLCILAASSSLGQRTAYDGAGTHGKKTVQAVRTELPVVLDGNLDEPAWRQAPVSLGFIQKDPQEGEPSSERTEFRVVYTAQTLYVGIICYDSYPQGILATERRRDNNLENDDTVSLVLDTFHDHRNSYLFRTNPLGAQYDALITDEGNNSNKDWDERWNVVAQMTPVGWVAEFAIPFKSLRVRESEDGLIWGLDLERVIRRKNEFSYWNGYRRGFRLENVSQAGHLTGLEGIETGLRLRIKPYVLGGVSQSVRRATPGSDASRTVTKGASDIGVEVMKYRITPSLTADLTWNTDFAQTDVDALQENLDRFPLLFPEKREFFQEGAGIFDFGVGAGITTGMRLFHSRQIGLSPRGRPVPIVGGGRITGKLQGVTLGLLNVQTEALPEENISASNYGVLRAKRNVFSRSSVGGFLMNREKRGSSDYNRVYGMDANFTFYKHLDLNGFFAKSEQPGAKGKWVASANAGWYSDFFQMGLQYLSVDPDFRDDLGFLRRTNFRRFGPSIGFRPRPNLPWVRQFEFSGSWDYAIDHRGRVIRRTDKYIFQMFFQDGGTLRIIPFDYEFDRVEADFQISGVAVPKGDYQWNVWVLRYHISPKRRFYGALDFSHRYGFYEGNMYKFQLSPSFKVSEHFSIETNYDFSIASLPAGDFSTHVMNFVINYNFNNQWLTSSTIQYNNADSFMGVNFRLNYIFRPGDDFFLIYNEGRRVAGSLDRQKDRTLQAKFTYSFDF